MRRLTVLLLVVACDDPDAPPPQDPWQARMDLPARRLEAAAAGNGSRLVVVGGFATGVADTPRLQITNEVLQYDPFSEEWTALPPLPVAWTHAALAGVGGSLYVLGGLEGETFVPNGRTFRLRAGDAAWTELEPMPAGLERGAAGVLHTPGHIFLFGGETPTGQTATILDYVIADNEWQQLEPAMPTPRSHAAVMREQDGTFIVAGGVGLQGPLGDVHALSLLDGWSLRAPMNEPHGGCAYGVLYGQLVCAGGETVANGMVVPSQTVEVYDPTLDEWTISTQMPVPTAGAPGAVVTSRLYVVGGSRTPVLEPTSTLFELDLLDTLPK